MVDPHTASWFPAAAYLYVLHLDPLALAWEYLRRNPDYRRDWLRRRRQRQAASGWGLRRLEDPGLDARDAHPAWLSGRDSVVQLHPDVDPPSRATAFRFWRLPGCKQLVHDSHGLLLTAQRPGGYLRLALAPGLEEGMPYVCAVRARAVPRMPPVPHAGAVRNERDADAALPRPLPTALLEMHTLQALDATLADASARDVAVGLFGDERVARDWYADGGLRSRVRRLVRRGGALMRGDYRRLAQLD